MDEQSGRTVGAVVDPEPDAVRLWLDAVEAGGVELDDAELSVEQASVVVRGLDRLPDELDAGQREAVAEQLVGLAGQFGPQGLARLVNRTVEVIAPVDLDTLRGQVGTGTLLNAEEKLTAQQARRLACDAQILPVIMDGKSVPLDVGRAKRLFTGHLRTLLIARDQGCAFPGCDRPPAECEGHHRRPWWAGGPTSLHNGVLVCTFHHHLVEPDPHAPPQTQWAIRLDANGNPEFGAPEGRGAPPHQRRWRQHHRYQTR